MGVFSIDQLVPSQRSTNGISMHEPEPLAFKHPAPTPNEPTAIHAAADVHDTDVSAPVTAPAGLGAVWTDQLAPFHASTRGDSSFALPEDPTAVHAVADEHDTPWSAAVDPEGTDTSWIDQSLPFQSSAKGADPFGTAS
jgi:hypothetical protein